MGHRNGLFMGPKGAIYSMLYLSAPHTIPFKRHFFMIENDDLFVWMLARIFFVLVHVSYKSVFCFFFVNSKACLLVLDVVFCILKQVHS